MTVRVKDLIAAPLDLRAVSATCAQSMVEISWVSTTELPDPRQFLRGNELVLTIGLQNRTAAQQRAFVESLVSVPVAALGYATGLIHKRIPRAVIDTAESTGLALFEIPLQTPFIAISHWVADQLYSERYAFIRQATVAQDELTKALLGGLGLGPLMRKLHSLVGAPVAVIDTRGHVLDSSPRRASWPSIAQIKAAAPDPIEGVSVWPVYIEGVTVAYLCGKQPADVTPVMPFAVGLIGLELARRQAILTGRREVIGQTIHDIVFKHVAPGEAERRLSAYGFAPSASHRMLVGRVTASDDQLRRVPSSVLDLVAQPNEGMITAIVDDMLIALIPGSENPTDVAAALRDSLLQLGTDVVVGVGREHEGVRGIRVGFFEALQALSKGPGVQEVEPLSLPDLLLSNAEIPVCDIARASLQPLLDYDEERGSDLIKTLRVFLEAGCSPGRTAERLVIHRNGLQYRLQRIGELTGRDLSSIEDRVHFWLALTALNRH
ncbi:PucR family transcriptional regulator [Streptomyces arenae]|uniref:PucR family transcriptional regulator n=1 Tax=Streptomyces arenae TaxID=29301 RepID=UPI00265B383F|nr:PucR family transcriptional regulator [Streptomyces arenae]MCG7207383.1 PucR family transcriptional regulator ligand-binding domain-containing protein [Streptomyces arenae]